MTTAEQLYETVKDLPDPAIAELLDFAEFLRGKKFHGHKDLSDLLLLDLIGGLENSATYHGDPLALQQRLRDEWN